MIPSRGLRPVSQLGRLSLQCRPSSHRNFSSRAPRSPLILAQCRQPKSSSLLSQKSPWRSQTFVAPFLVSSPRFASTTSSDSTSPASNLSSDVTSTSLDDILKSGTLHDEVLSQGADRLGYLKEIGLDYGWGPTSMVQWAFEHVHVYTGMPWWGSIVVSTILFRLLLIPIYIRMADSSAKMHALKPVTDQIKDKLKVAQDQKDQYAMAQANKEMWGVYKDAGINPFASVLPLLIQMPLGYGAFKLCRQMGNLPVPGLEEGGFWWLTDLTLPDPYYIMPAVTGGVMYWVMKSATGGSSEIDISNPLFSPSVKKFMLYGMPILFTTTTALLAGSVQLFIVAGTLVSSVQTVLFKRPAVRKVLGIYPLPATQTKKGGKSEPVKVEPTGRLRYQAPTSQASSHTVQPHFRGPNSSHDHSHDHAQAPAKKSKGIIAGAKKEISGTWKSITNAVLNKDKVEQGKMTEAQKKQQKQKEAFLAEAQAYEENAKRQRASGSQSKSEKGKRKKRQR